MSYKQIILIIYFTHLTTLYQPISPSTFPKFDSDLLTIKFDLFHSHINDNRFLLTITLLKSRLENLQSEATSLSLKKLYMGYNSLFYLPAIKIFYWAFSFRSQINGLDLLLKNLLIKLNNSNDKNLSDFTGDFLEFCVNNAILDSFGQMKSRFIPQGKLEEGRLFKLDKMASPEIEKNCPIDIFVFMRFYETKKHIVLKTKLDFEFERYFFKGRRAVNCFSMVVDDKKRGNRLENIAHILVNVFSRKKRDSESADE